MTHCKNRYKINNAGVTLMELIIAIGIMAVLTSILTPQFLRYLNRSKKTVDIHNAEVIGQAVERAFAFNVETYDIYMSWKPTNRKLHRQVTVTVDGVQETYWVYCLIATEDKGFYSGGEGLFKKKLSNGMSFYDILNEELGIRYEKDGNASRADYVNDIMIPKYKIEGPHTNSNGRKVDRWRICKREDDGRLEVWSAYDLQDGDSGGGKPCYRVWPVPDDIYK